MNVLLILGSLGSVMAFLGVVVAVARGIFRVINATEANTRAVEHLTEKIDGLGNKVIGHETRITVLEDRRRGRGSTS